MTGNSRPEEGPVQLDGGEGEGGGQILRSALSLSLITGRPFHITGLRERREPPGLRPQHLACVRGAEAISASNTEGALVGSSELSFTPGPVRTGDYVLEVGTAGSTLLVFQCLFFPLALAGGGQLTLRGGTHVPHSPSYHYLGGVWVPAMHAFGLSASLSLTHAGFYPEGAGEFHAEVLSPREPPALVDLPARGTLQDITVSTFVGGLPFSVADRQSRATEAALRERGLYCHTQNRPLPVTRSAGSVTFILAQFENTFAGFSAVGERSSSPEEVGREAAEAVARFMESSGAIDEHLGDQLLLPAALLAGGRLGAASPGTTRFTAARVTEHLMTHARVLERFLPVKVAVAPDGAVEVRPA